LRSAREHSWGAGRKPCEQPGLALLDKAMQLSEAVEGGELAGAGCQIVERVECDEVRGSQAPQLLVCRLLQFQGVACGGSFLAGAFERLDPFA
jgi:hypothetical protein